MFLIKKFLPKAFLKKTRVRGGGGPLGRADQKTKEICLEHPWPFFDTWRYGKSTLLQSKSKKEGERKSVRTWGEVDGITIIPDSSDYTWVRFPYSAKYRKKATGVPNKFLFSLAYREHGQTGAQKGRLSHPYGILHWPPLGEGGK
eukprot:sb/3473927/